MISSAPTAAAHVASTAQHANLVFHLSMLATMSALIFLLAVLFRTEALSVDLVQYAWFITDCLIPLGIVSGYCHWAHYYPLRDSCLLVEWMCVFVNLMVLLSYAAARSPFPLQDNFLTSGDALLGIHVGSAVSYMHKHRALSVALQGTYTFLPVFVFAAVFLPGLCGNLRAAKRFVIASTAAGIVTIAVFVFTPAIGPWASGSFTPFSDQSAYADTFAILRAARPFVIHRDSLHGLITFPSFHVTLAVLSGVALWPLKRVRWITALFSVLMAVSTVTTGWHYATDGIAGLLIAVAAIFTTKRLVRVTASAQRRPISVTLGVHTQEF